jgi:hypothetical protein
MSDFLRSVPLRLRLLAGVAVAALIAVAAAEAVTSRTTTAPANSSAPTISGDVVVGSTLTVDTGTWTGSTPMSFQYQWRTCHNISGTTSEVCSNIAGATSQTYAVRSSDRANWLRARVIASNADGSAAATSASSGIVAAATAPVNTAPPTINGNNNVGSTLTANPGTWTSTGSISYKYQWRVCSPDGGACRDIPGATAPTYQLTANDLGNALRVVVTATDPNGSKLVTSSPTPSIAASLTGCPKLAAGASSVAVADVSAPARLQIDQMQSSPSVITRGTRVFTVKFHVSDTCGDPVQGAEVYATGVPYHMISIPAIMSTDSSGFVSMQFMTLSGFPATSQQQLMVMFVRATKPGDSVLAGVSTRRLISVRVNLHG